MVNLDRRLPRPGATIAFADSGGDGLAVALTHGAGLDHSMFEVQAALLERLGFRVIIWDLRGHGQSPLTEGMRFTACDALDDLEALLMECDVSAPVLIGHSLGGNLVQAFAQRHRGSVRGVIVMDSTWNNGPVSTLDRLALRLAAPLLALIPASRLPRIMARASAATSEGIVLAEETFSRMTKPRFVDVWRATMSFVDPDPGRRFPTPLALVRGAEDRTGNIATAMPRWALAEGIDEHVIPGAGHIITWDASELASRTLVTIVEDWNLEPTRLMNHHDNP